MNEQIIEFLTGAITIGNGSKTIKVVTMRYVRFLLMRYRI